MREITVAIIGMGSRGRHTYGRMLKKIDNARLVAIADVKPDALEEAAKEFNIPKEGCFNSADSLLSQPRLADIVFICTPDECHADQAVAALKKGYHLLLEKPIATTYEDCRRVHATAKESGKMVVICHVLRFTPFYQKIKELISDGAIGDVVTLNAIERVVYWHQAHSFVRGNWRNLATSAPMILAKSCHDMDIVRWLVGKRCESISSYGSLTHFVPENAPEGSTDRCKDCPIENCIYNCYDFYLPQVNDTGLAGWPADILDPLPTKTNVLKALDNGPYGRCVYRCDNDVVDHQVVNMLFEGGVTANFTMTAFTATGGRAVSVMGTKGEIRADMDTNIIDVLPFGKERYQIDVSKIAEDFSGHAGGDIRMLNDFIQAIASDKAPDFVIDESVESHYMAFAAEVSRLDGGRPVKL